jgi:serine O-acetyltransferase
MRDWRGDLYRYSGVHGFRANFRTFLGNPGARYMVVWRERKALEGARGPIGRVLRIFYRLLLYRMRFRFGFDIPIEAEIGPGLYIGHFGRLTVNPGVKIGANVNLSPGVALGGTYRGSKAGAPTLGNRVWIGTNAVVVGRVNVGDGAMIAPNAFVNFDVPENAVVVGNPGQVVSDHGSRDYVNHLVE